VGTQILQKRQEENYVAKERVFNHQDLLDDTRGLIRAWPHAFPHTDDWVENPFEDANCPPFTWAENHEAPLCGGFFVQYS
jgi:hypothetical protein